jgi:hypothetical protein
MGLFSRFQLQRSSLLALLVGIVFGVATGWLSTSTAGIVGALALLTLILPMQYTFTTRGVALGDGMFYPWDGFSGFIAGENKLVLTHPSIFGRLTLYVKPAEMTDVLQYVERYVRKTNSVSLISAKENEKSISSKKMANCTSIAGRGTDAGRCHTCVCTGWRPGGRDQRH